ncbi:MAG: Glycosyl transferase group 1 [Candidatus Roizmanbacteria bacterium GW2011_GWA2_34_18]|uniref:Glycosyl transferase group 1 n=1 Tax=Candidatus Roizmanbacteria bacterium GW2011_GWA2_34_18 TaxID=1618477 RepID=A0A0G0DYU4_9BACT|nr:MAG: Glycosyl transferase group 1 [Candidatus Roizmanbacteria bacterium GW2011_GWA2_34_18]
MKKIVFFSTYYDPYLSGLTIYPKYLFEHLKKNSKIIVLTFPHRKNLKKIEKKGNITIIRLNYWFRLSKGFIAPLSLLDFYRYSKGANIVFLNQPNFEGLGLAFLAFLMKKKIISIIHCQVFLPRSFFNIIINFFLNLYLYCQLFLSTIILPTTEDYAFSLPWGKIFRYKIKAILPPIKKSIISQVLFKKLKKEREKYLIGYVGRIASEKGIEYLVHSINHLDIKKNVKLVFAGPFGKDVAGENNYYNKIIEMLKKYKVNYLFFGNLTSKQLAAFYKSIDVLVLPSINQTEAFGMVQAEAMVAGTPVVASNLPGVRMPIKMTGMGKIVEPKDVNGIANAIEEVLKNKNSYSNLRLTKNAKNIFDLKKIYKFYENLVNEKN